VSADILNETARVLGTKFSVPADDVEAFCSEVCGFSRLVMPTEKLSAVPQDPTDNPILVCAVEAGSETVVTGDAHLLSLGDFRGIRIQRIADFLGGFHARGQ
jgi:predicted nucleic acid-binding protein